nr:PAP2 superfamily [uncultured organism]
MSNKLIERIPLRVMLITGVFLLSFFLFAFLAEGVMNGKERIFDSIARNFLVAHSTPFLIRIMRGLTFLGSSNFLLPAYVVLIVGFLLKKNFRRAINILIVSLSSFLVMQGLKQVFRRQRPESAVLEGLTSYSFPSGHSLSGFVFCSILAYLVWRGHLSSGWKLFLITLLFLLAVGIGISRIVLGVHYATDVMAGFCLGVMWVIMSFRILRKVRG